MSFNNQSYETKTDKSHSEESGTLDGSGGGTMEIWKKERVAKLDSLVGGSFTNNSSFKLPAGIVNSSSSPYETTWSNEENFMGVTARGTPLSAGGSPLSGEASIESGGEVITSTKVSDVFIISAPPPSGVEDGSDKQSEQFDFRFAPSTAGVDLFKENFGTSYDAGLFQYGEVSGTVTDYDGNPVAGAAVFGEGEGTTTNQSGKYSIAAPGGTSVDLTSLNKTETVTKTPSAGSTITVDFQFARIIVSVVDPELNPLPGTAVEIGDESYETDDEGKVVVERAGIEPLTVVIDDEEEFTVEPTSQGQLVEEQYGDTFSGYRVTLRETVSGLPIQSTTVTFVNKGIASQTNGNGRASTLSDIDGEKEVRLGDGDRRYETKTVTVNVTKGEIKSEKTTLSRRSNTPTIS